MNKDEFLSALAEKGRGKFTKTKFGDLVRSDDEKGLCPVCFLCLELTGQWYVNHDFKLAGEVLGLEYGLMNLVVDAADKPLSPSRRILLETLGLE